MGTSEFRSPQEKMSRRVLFVGGEEGAFVAMKQALAKEPYELCHVDDEALAYVFLREKRASVVVAEENLPQGRAADFLAEVRQRHPSTVRIMVTGTGDRAGIIDAVNRAEVYRFLSRPLQPLLLARTLRDALTIARVAEAQEAVWVAAKQQQEAMQRLLSSGELSDTGDADLAVSRSRFASRSAEAVEVTDSHRDLPLEFSERLSTREREIVSALGNGHRVKDIAQDLVISTHTVRNHLKAIYRKLNVNSQFELIGLMGRH